MKFLNSIFARSLGMIILLISFWIWAGLSLSDRINTNLYHQDVQSLLTESRELSMEIIRHTRELIDLESPGIHYETEKDISELEQKILNLVSNLNILQEDPVFSENLALIRKINIIIENSEEIIRISNECITLLKEKGDVSSGLLQTLNGDIGEINQFSDSFNTYLLSYNYGIIERIIDQITSEVNPDNLLPENHKQIADDLQNLLEIDYKLGWYFKNGHTGNLIFYSGQISDELKILQNEYSLLSAGYLKNYSRRFLIFMIFLSLIMILVIFHITRLNLKGLEEIVEPLSDLSKGILPASLPKKRVDEFEKIHFLLLKINENLKLKIKFAGSIAEEKDQNTEIKFNEKDELGNELNRMAEKIKKAREEDIIHKEEDRRRSWHSEGLASFGEIFRSERDNLEELAFKVIRKLVNYLDASLGSLFVLNDEEENVFLESIATYAYDRRKYYKKKVRMGVGLAGVCALEKETIYLNQVPDDYIHISSGLGETSPTSLLIVPLKLENEIFGIIEIASIREFKDFEINFVEHLAESIATTLAAVRINIKTGNLLEQSQVQASNMKEQEEIMKKNVQALERAQNESLRKESEITGILNAVNASSLVAEFSLNGRFAQINDQFLVLLETTREQVIGKHHSEFAEVDKYSDEYKKFWRRLRNGELISRTEKFRLINEKEIWLNQTYTPILNKDSNTIKILNIAHDITKTTQQQISLENQANEIARQSLEMKSLSDAVDQSIIKCEHSPDGLIIEANQNFCEITGLSSREIMGKNARLFLKDDEKQQFDTILAEVRKNKAYTGVVKRSKPTGEQIWLMANFTPVADEDNRIYKIFFLAQDITEKKLKYQLLEEANKEIERLKKELERING